MIKTFKVGLANEKNDWGSLREGYKALSDVVKARPELAKDVFEAFKVGLANEENNRYGLAKGYKALRDVVEARPELAKDIFSDILLPKSDYSELVLVLGAKCMKKCKIDDFKNLTNEQEKYLRVLSKLKYLKESEISYFINNYGADKIEDYSFGPQQRCMNVLMAKLGEESGLPKEETVNYRKDIENKTYQDNADWLEPASFKGAEVFGCWFPGYIKKTTKYLSVHDSVYWLPENMGDDKNKSFVSFVERNLVYTDNNAEKKVRSLNEMEIIAKNWKYLKPEEEKGSFKDILGICLSRKYEDQEYTAFATEAAKAGVSEETYKDYEDIYKAGLKVPEPFDSSKEFRFVNYVGRFLPRDDARVGFFGNYTDCCQHFSGVGKSCAISTIKDPYSQLFVIEKDGKIVAGSWVWENKEGKYRDVCFDNIEAIGNFAENPMINKIYEQAGIYLTEEANCRKVTIGMGYQDADVSGYNKTENIALPTQYGSAYSDAKGTQVLLAENKEAKPLDKTQESKRFVREACLLDFEKLDKISEICFPDSDAGLQKAGDRLSGLVLVDEIKGAVGYCLYDEEEKYISDMAVLPEYRKDKNASSQKLMAEMIKKIKEIGGEWSAELREGTTLRYMKIMQERGIVDMQIGEVDHVMDDGSKVYSVTFKPKETQREKTNKLSIQPDKNRDIR